MQSQVGKATYNLKGFTYTYTCWTTDIYYCNRKLEKRHKILKVSLIPECWSFVQIKSVILLEPQYCITDFRNKQAGIRRSHTFIMRKKSWRSEQT